MNFYFAGFLNIVVALNSEKYFLNLNNKMTAKALTEDESTMQSSFERTLAYFFMK